MISPRRQQRPSHGNQPFFRVVLGCREVAPSQYRVVHTQGEVHQVSPASEKRRQSPRARKMTRPPTPFWATSKAEMALAPRRNSKSMSRSRGAAASELNSRRRFGLRRWSLCGSTIRRFGVILWFIIGLRLFFGFPRLMKIRRIRQSDGILKFPLTHRFIFYL
jgi:hypothetical protein